MEIAKYYASLGFVVPRDETNKVDNYLKNLSKKFSNFQVNMPKLTKTLGDALDQASLKTVFEISKFSVNQRNLQASMMRSMRGVTVPVSKVQATAQGVATQAPQSSQRAQVSRANYMHAGGSAGALARYGIGSLPFIGGVYGLSQVNTVSQELQANQLALKAVAGDKAGGYSEFLNNLGNRLGMTTRDLQPGFTQYLASAQGTALEPTIQKDFTNFAQYGAVMGLGPEEMKGSLKAVTQMVSKQQIYAEELKGQLAERMPAAVRMMADAVTGGDTKALLKMMEDGKLDPNEALPKFFEEMRKRSESMLPEYFKTSRFAQGSMNKAAEDSLKVFASEGGDKGFTNFFNRMTEAMKAAQPLIKALAGSFEDLTKVLQAPIYMFDRMNQTLTILSQTTGIAEKNFTNLAMVGGLMMTKWGRVGMIFTTMLIALEDISMGVSGEGDSFTGRFIKWMEESGVVMGPFEKGLFGVSAGMLAIAAALKAISVSTSLPGIGDVFGKSGGTGKDGKPTKGSKGWAGKLFNYAAVPALLAGGYYLGSGMGDDPALDQYGYKDVTKMQQMQYTSPSLGGQLMSTGIGFQLGGLLGAAGGAAYGSLGNYVPYNPSESSSLNLDLLISEMVRIREAAGLVSDARSAGAFGPLNPKVDITMKVDIVAASPEDFTDQFQTQFKSVIESTLLQYGQKE